MPGPFCAMHTPWRPETREKPSAMWAAPCSCTVGTKRMPAAGKRSSASMYAEPTMPNTSVTPCATSVSTNASEGVMRVRPETTMRFTSAILVMEGSRKNEKAVQSLTSRVLENDNLAKCRARKTASPPRYGRPRPPCARRQAPWQKPFSDPYAQTGRGSSVRRHDPDARARDTPELRTVPAADVVRPWLGTRDILVRDRTAEPRVGPRHALRRRDRRPLRRGTRARRGGPCLRPGPVGHGALDRTACVRSRRRAAGGTRPGVHRVRRSPGSGRARVSPREEKRRGGHRWRLRLLRPVRHAAVGRGADFALRLAQCAARARGLRLRDDSARRRARRSQSRKR